MITQGYKFEAPGRKMQTYFYGGIFIREHYLETGQTHRGHTHTIDHLTVLVSGSAEVRIGDAEPVIMSAPCNIPIDKDVLHSFTATEDLTYYCVFSIRDAEVQHALDTVGHHRDFAQGLASKLCGNCTGCK